MTFDKTISSIMTRDVISVTEFTLLEDVFELFKTHRFHHLPVIKEDKSLVGIISTIDLATVFDPLITFNQAKSWQETRRYFKSMTAKDIMEKEVTFLHPQQKISVAYEIFKDNEFHSLPIVEDGQLVGILTTYDLLTHAYAAELQVKS